MVKVPTGDQTRGTSIGRLWTQSLCATSVLWMELWPALRKGRASLSPGTMGDPSHSWFLSNENAVNERCRRRAILSHAAASVIAGSLPFEPGEFPRLSGQPFTG